MTIRPRPNDDLEIGGEVGFGVIKRHTGDLTGTGNVTLFSDVCAYPQV